MDNLSGFQSVRYENFTKKFFQPTSNAKLQAAVVKSKITHACVVVAIRPLPRDGGMAEDHGAPEAGQISRAWTRGRRETRESPKSERRKESVAGPCRMR